MFQVIHPPYKKVTLACIACLCFEIGVCSWPDLSALFQYTSPTPVVSLHMILRIQYHPGIPVTLLTGYSFFFFSSATKWKNCAIVPRGHWALNTMTTNCDPMRCSHTDHACYPSTPWQLTVIQWGVHMLITRVILMMIDVVMHRQGRVTWQTRDFAYKTLRSVVLYFNVFGLRSPGAL